MTGQWLATARSVVSLGEFDPPAECRAIGAVSSRLGKPFHEHPAVGADHLLGGQVCDCSNYVAVLFGLSGPPFDRSFGWFNASHPLTWANTA